MIIFPILLLTNGIYINTKTIYIYIYIHAYMIVVIIMRIVRIIFNHENSLLIVYNF